MVARGGERSALERQVHDALAHLHDLPYLQTHPLVSALPVEPDARPAAAARRLQAALLETIDALASGESASAGRGQRVHRLLVLRYVEALEAPAVWRQLGLGKSEYYVQHGRGLAAVASLLRERWSVDSAGPSAGGTSTSSGTLPGYLTDFVGRRVELATLGELLSRARLVVLVGPAGAGKTRLAIEVAAAARPEYPHGVWFADLSALVQDEQVAGAVMALFGLRDAPGRARTDTIAGHLRDRRLLLVLDNCEHLVAAAAALAEVLVSACPGVRILATSREPLGVAGETRWPLPPLPTPPADAAPPAEELPRYDAVLLFVERVRAVRPAFELTEANAPAVARICRRLDGIPLAIELAAARAAGLSVEEIAERLDEALGPRSGRLRLLVHGSRTAPPRQQTLRASLDWSHDLLAESERALLRRLAVFSGGWTLEASEAVCLGDGVEAGEVLDLLLGLVAKSLVQADPSGPETRYRLLETVREYAAEKLAEAGEVEAARRAHAAWCLALAERPASDFCLRPAARGPDRRRWLDRLELEHENLRTALAWVESVGDAVLGLRLGAALSSFWFLRGYRAEGGAWLDRFLAAGDAAPPLVRARALRARASLSERSSADLERVERCAAENLAICRALGDPADLIAALVTQAVVKSWLDAHVAVVPLAEEAVALARDVRDRELLLLGLVRLGNALHATGAAARAQMVAEEANALAKELEIHTALTARLLGHVALAGGDAAGAACLFEQDLAQVREIDDQAGVWISLANLGAAYLAMGDRQRAAARFADGLVALRGRFPFGRAAIVRCLEGLASLSRRPERAACLLGAADALWPPSWGGPLADPAPADRRIVEVVRARLDPAALAAAWAAGQAMTADEAIAFALTEGAD
jgi:predicted ATPase